MLDKIGDTSYCNNNRRIALLSTPSNVFHIVTLQKLNKCIENHLRENLFRWNRSCMDQLFALKKMIKGCIENNIPMKINYIYFHPEFDPVRHEYIKASVKPLWFTCQIHQDLSNILRKHLDQTLTD